jgi:hypothetical protein
MNIYVCTLASCPFLMFLELISVCVFFHLYIFTLFLCCEEPGRLWYLPRPFYSFPLYNTCYNLVSSQSSVQAGVNLRMLSPAT